MDDIGSHDLPTQPGNRQAPLVVGPLAVALDDPWVDDGASALTHVIDEDAALHADLIGRQSGTGSLVHRLDHGVDQTRHLSVDLLDFTGALSRARGHRIGEWSDSALDHSTGASTGATSPPFSDGGRINLYPQAAPCRSGHLGQQVAEHGRVRRTDQPAAVGQV